MRNRKRHKLIMNLSGQLAGSRKSKNASEDEYIREMKLLDRLARFDLLMYWLRKIASLNTSERLEFTKSLSWTVDEVAKAQSYAKDRLNYIKRVNDKKIVLMLTLSAQKNQWGGFDLEDNLRTWNRFLYFFCKGNYELDGYVVFETKKGSHPHVHILLYENSAKTGLSLADIVKPSLQFGFAMKQCKKLNPLHCDIRQVSSNRDYLVGDYLVKEVGEGINGFDCVDRLEKGQIKSGHFKEKFGGLFNEVRRVSERTVSASA